MGRPAKKRAVEDIYPEAFVVIGNITWLQKRFNTPESEIIQAFGKNQNTWIKRKNQPWDLSIEELTNIAGIWGLKPEQLMVQPKLIVEPCEII